MCFSIQVDLDLKKLAQRFQAKIAQAEFDRFAQLSQENPKLYKTADEAGRIYPNYHAPVIIVEAGEKIIKPMRYQLLPHFCEAEKYTRINPKTNRKVQIKTYNARIDALEERHAWKNIFMKRHAIVPFKRFYEYLPRNGKSALASFNSKNHELMWAACLWDCWISADQKTKIESFAIITDEPPIEVEQAGHDRCPIFLKEELLDDWLNPMAESRDEIYEMLSQKEPTIFEYALI